jgi:tetratricopeptide (TPR) repeat protein
MIPDDPRVQRLLDELLDPQATPEQVCASCPELLPEVRKRWRQMRHLSTALDALFPARDERSPPGPELPEVPGYEVHGLLGRGGMGIVFRARHLRLNRPVALKMILAGPYAVPAELERFVREAQAVAGLRHPNVVQVYDAGELDGRPWFTMEVVEGGRLSEKIDGAPQPARSSAALVATVAGAIQVAHQSGIVHCDLKPGNILLTPDGTPKVSDFGVACRLEAGPDGAMTLTGLPLGTPSYMAPEQARGQKGAIGPAADVYALGAILYEMLTGRPPFRAETATATLQQVLADEPVPPARLNPQVPRDLETICLKCLQKEPVRRYASAQALAEDLGRFERGEPILARPLGHVGRLARWARRRPTAAALYATLLTSALLVLALVGAQLRLSGQRQASARAAEQDLREADGLLRQSNLNLARAALERAKGRLGAGAWPDLQKRVGLAEVELHRSEAEKEMTQQLKQRLEAIRMDRCVIVTGGHVDWLQPDREYEKALRSARLDVFGKDPTAVAQWIEDSPARAALVAALDDWAIIAPNTQRRDWLLAVARQADPDPWRNRARDPATFWDAATLEELARSGPPAQVQSVPLLVSLGQRLLTADRGAAVGFLRQVQREHPDDYYANLWLGLALDDPREKVGYFRAALALRPDAEAANYNIGKALDDRGQANESLPYLQRAVQLDPLNAVAQGGLGTSLEDMGRTDESIGHLQESVRLDPRTLFVRINLGLAYEKKGRLDEAVEQFEAAVGINSHSAQAHCDLANVLSKLGRRPEALEHCRAAVGADPKDLHAQVMLAQLLTDLGRLDEAAGHSRQAVALAPTDKEAQATLRTALARLGRLEELQSVWRTELDAGPPEHDAWFGYAELCLFLGNKDEYVRNRRELLVRFGGSKDATVCERTGKACLLLPGTKDELAEAAALTDRAVAAGRKGREFAYPYAVFAKGLAAYRLGRFDEAIALMSGDGAKAELMGPSPHLVTAMAQYQKGQRDQAKKTLAAAVISYDWGASKADSRDPWLAHILRREAEAMILPDLPAFLEGKYEPRDNDERLALLGVCQYKDLRAAMAGLYAAIFAGDPKLAEDSQAGHRYRAACCAAVAGCGGGADGAALSDPERARWRQQARQWLRLDLAERAKDLQAADPQHRARLLKALNHWRDDPDLAGLRDPGALDQLPQDERQECRALWSDLEAQLGAAPPAK